MLEKKTVLSESGRVHRFQFLEIVDIVVERNILTRYVQKIISFISTRQDLHDMQFGAFVDVVL